MNIMLERNEKGDYVFTEPETEQKAEMHQTVTPDTLRSMGLTQEQVDMLQDMKKENTANMEASMSGALDKVTNFQLMGLPIGKAAVGGAMAIVIDRIFISWLQSKVGNTIGTGAGTIINLGTAWAVKKYLGKYIGSQTADATALILTYEAIADWVTLGINKVWPTASASQVMHQTSSGGSMRQFERVASDYYSQIIGR